MKIELDAGELNLIIASLQTQADASLILKQQVIERARAAMEQPAPAQTEPPAPSEPEPQ